MSKQDRLTAERLRQLLHYEPSTGKFTRLVAHPRNRTLCVGTEAGSFNKARGRFCISVDDTSYLAHRLAWLYMTGNWPKHQIDHIDTNPANNRWDNLRDVTGSVNQQNKRRPHRRNSTGLLGVSRSCVPGKFQASIYVNKKLVHLGTFEDANAAHQAYVDAKRQLHEGNTL